MEGLPQLVLASSSPQRLALLQQVGIEPRLKAPMVDESLLSGETSEELVKRLAEMKARAVFDTLDENVLVIGSDCVVDLDGEILGKPDDADHAFKMLSKLVGRSHRVLTGVAVFHADRYLVDIAETVVWLKSVTDLELKKYVDCGEYVGKAGGCCVQGKGAVFVERFEGSYHNVVGLPLHLLDDMCKSLGWPLSSWSVVSKFEVGEK